MKQIKNHRTGNIIFEGDFASLRQCAEQAVHDGVCLDFADLGQANLVNAGLDEARLRHTRFSGANLMGANLSEADLDGADFTGAGLQNACLCFSSLRRCRFEGALFGATDIAGGHIDRSVFSTLSAFHLNFRDAESMHGCVYADARDVYCPFSRPPLVIAGLIWPVIIMDRHVKIGSWLKRHDSLAAGVQRGEEALHAFIEAQKNWLTPLIENFRSAGFPAGERLSA